MLVKDILIKQLSNIQEEKVALLLSGGIGSSAILSLLLELGKEVHVYTFHMKNIESTDLKKARAVASKFDLEFSSIVLPNTIDTIKKDCLFLINEIGCSSKTEVECSFPIKYVLEKIQENTLVCGLGDDAFFGLTKKAQINYNNSVEGMNYYREKSYASYSEKLKLYKRMGERKGISIVAPYQTKELLNIFHNTSYEQINKPKKKQWLIDMCSKEIQECKFYSANYQKGDSKISETFLQLLDSDWNTKNYKSVIGIYNSIKRNEIINI